MLRDVEWGETRRKAKSIHVSVKGCDSVWLISSGKISRDNFKGKIKMFFNRLHCWWLLQVAKVFFDL